MDAPGWLAPFTGLVALGTSLSLVGVYAYGERTPEAHDVRVRATYTVPADAVWALLVDMERRPTWRPNVDRIGRITDEQGRPTWRELDPGGDRFDFEVVEEARPRLVLAVARPEDLGMTASWEYTVAPAGSGSTLDVREQGSLENPFFRGWWWLTTGPYAGIEPDLEAIGRVLGSETVIERL